MNQTKNINPSVNQDINNAFYYNANASKFSAPPQNMNFIQPQYNMYGVYGGNVADNSANALDNNQLNANPEKNKKEDDKKNLKGRSLIQEIIQDTEISMNQSGKDYEKNSNLYLCNY